jgi:D-alanyl-D-alanine carboxypeptidase
MRRLWAPYRCIKSSSEPTVQAELWDRKEGRTPPVCVDGWAALVSTLLATGYRKPKTVELERLCPPGIKMRDCTKSVDNCSLHNYGLAIDIDPKGVKQTKAGNPHFEIPFAEHKWDFDDIIFKRHQVEAVEAIRTTKGVKVFRWLGWSIGDTMHFEFTLSPEDLARGIDPETVQVPDGQQRFTPMNREEVEEDMAFTPEEEAFLKDLFKVVVKDMNSNAKFAKSAITDIRKDVITKRELRAAFKGLPTDSVDSALKELMRRLA